MTTTNKPQHTQGEWRISDTRNSYNEIGINVPLTDSNILCWVGSEANARRIVTAVNCHDELVEALKTFVALFERGNKEENTLGYKSIQKAKAALKKTE